MKTLYVTDLDGTLLNQAARVSERSIEIINRLVEEGMLFTYATARSLVSASVATDGLTAKIPVIAYNGAFIFKPDTGEVLHSVKFTAEEMKSIREVLEKNNISPLVYSVIDGMDRLSWDVNRENEGMRNYLSRRQGDRRLRPLQGDDGLYAGEVFYFTCVGTDEELKPLYDVMSGSEPEQAEPVHSERRMPVTSYGCDIVNMEPRYICTLQKELYQPEYFCEIMPTMATKAQAIAKLKELWGCERIVSFGDAVNDIPMFRISDECYAVENAVEELKALATGIIASNEQDGVAKWLLENVL